ncbi:tetratricopeptide repeat protein [Larkinella insperata]|uniref:Tetratricopeptide repeat protein n=1 Tax=Larkinella insperata TaxID=332158 RepID=A0ABW3PWV9_9BACT|nr:tetratricopeptide repeat protein [Larkinella insperata]
MKRLSFFLLAGFLSVGAYAQQQGLDALTEKTFQSEKEKSDKAITDEKSSVKPKTWLDRAKTYENIATQAIKLDSNAANVAYEAYQKVIELDKDKKSGGPGKMAKEAEEALKGQPLFQAFMNSGIYKYQAKNFKDAATLMTRAGEINPKDTTAALYAGIFSQNAEKPADAKANFERYIANGGKDVSVYTTLVSLYYQDKEVEKAVATIDKGLSVFPNNKDLTTQRTSILVTSGKMDDAITSLKDQIAKEPNNVNNLLTLAGIYDSKLRDQSDELKKLKGDAKKGPNATKQLADEKTVLKESQNELTRLTARQKREPKNVDVKNQITRVKQMIADSQTKITGLEKEVQQQAQQSQAAGNQEQKLAELTKSVDESRGMVKEYYNKALQVDPNNFDANFNLGAAYFNEAIQIREQLGAMDMKEYQAKGKEIEGQVCGKFKQALPYFQKAKSVKDTDQDLNDNLTNLQNILKQFEDNKVVCIESK